jgi:hypothetical protein
MVPLWFIFKRCQYKDYVACIGWMIDLWWIERIWMETVVVLFWQGLKSANPPPPQVKRQLTYLNKCLYKMTLTKNRIQASLLSILRLVHGITFEEYIFPEIYDY